MEECHPCSEKLYVEVRHNDAALQVLMMLLTTAAVLQPVVCFADPQVHAGAFPASQPHRWGWAL